MQTETIRQVLLAQGVHLDGGASEQATISLASEWLARAERVRSVAETAIPAGEPPVTLVPDGRRA